MATLPRFVIDSVAIVHYAYCEWIFEDSTPYMNGAKDTDDMLAILARSDVSNNHSAPSPLVPCDHCLLGLPVEP